MELPGRGMMICDHSTCEYKGFTCNFTFNRWKREVVGILKAITRHLSSYYVMEIAAYLRTEHLASLFQSTEYPPQGWKFWGRNWWGGALTITPHHMHWVSRSGHEQLHGRSGQRDPCLSWNRVYWGWWGWWLLIDIVQMESQASRSHRESRRAEQLEQRRNRTESVSSGSCRMESGTWGLAGTLELTTLILLGKRVKHSFHQENGWKKWKQDRQVNWNWSPWGW